MKSYNYPQDSDLAEINLAPLIDMMFLLLIFFIVTTALVEEVGIEVQKPRAASSEPLEKKGIMIAVTADDRVVYGGKEIGLSTVRGLVSRLLAAEERPVIVITDQASHSGVLVDVIDECKLAGAKTVSVATEKE